MTGSETWGVKNCSDRKVNARYLCASLLLINCYVNCSAKLLPTTCTPANTKRASLKKKSLYPTSTRKVAGLKQAGY